MHGEVLGRLFQHFGRGALDDGLDGGTAFRMDAELLADKVAELFGHQTVGSELAAEDGHHAFQAFFRMVGNMEASAGTATGRRALGHVKRTSAGKGAQDAVAAQVRDEDFADIEEFQDVGRGNVVRIGAIGMERGRAEDGDGAVGHEDVAVGALVQAVDDAGREAVVEGDERSAVGLDAHFKAHELHDLGRPGTCGVHHHVAGDTELFARHGVAGAHALHLSGFLFDGDDFVVRQHFAAVAAGGHGVVPHEAETVHAGIRHAVHGADGGVERRLKAQGFLDIHLFCGDARPAAGFHPRLFKVGIVLLGEDEEAFGFFHTFLADAAQDHVFFNAFLGRLVVFHRIAAAAVQQAVIAGTGTGSDTALFQQYGLDSAHAEVAQDAYTCGAAADNDYSRVFHTASLPLVWWNFHL